MTGIIKMAQKNRRLSIVLRFAAIMLLMWNLQLSASTVTWTGAGPNNNLSTVANWTCGGGPCTAPMTSDLVSTADVTFPGGLSSARLGPVDTSSTSGITLDSLTITGSEYTAFTINAGVTLTISNTSLNSTFDLTGSGGTDNSVSSGGTISVTGGALTSASGIFLTSAGSLLLSGATTVTNTGGNITNTA